MSKRPKGFFKGAEAEARTQGKAMSPGTSASGGTRHDGTGGTTGTTGTKKKITTTGNGVKNLSLVGNIWTKNPIGAAINIFSRFGKKKTEKEKVEANIKKGYDVTNPAEMHRATTKKTYDWGPQNGGDGMAQITLNTQSVASAAIPETKKSSGWGFQAYDSGSTANTRLYGKKGNMVKANQGQFSQGKRFGPPPTKGPDPQGINAPLNNVDYFKDLL